MKKKNIDGFIKAAKALGITNFPSKEDLSSQERDISSIVVEFYLTQNGVKPDFLPTKNSDYTNYILTEFSQNPQDLKLKEQAINQLEDIKSGCLPQKNSSVGSSLKNSIPQSNEEQKKYTKNGFNIEEKMHDLKQNNGSRTVTQTINFHEIGGNKKGSGTASVTIGSDGAVTKELKKQTEATNTVSTKSENGNYHSTTTTKTTTSYSSSYSSR